MLAAYPDLPASQVKLNKPSCTAKAFFQWVRSTADGFNIRVSCNPAISSAS